MEKRLIPYSVHLPEPIYLMVKEAANQRRASGLVRDAIVAFIENRDKYQQGYQAGLDAAIKKVGNNKVANAIAYGGETIGNLLIKDLRTLSK